MHISVEISSYPLADDYIPAIKTFIEQVQDVAGLTVVTNTMSTQIFGELSLVMSTLEQAMLSSWNQFGKNIFVCKFIGTNLDPALKPHG